MKGDTHPVREERILRLKQELARWHRTQAARRKAASTLPLHRAAVVDMLAMAVMA